MQKAGYTWNAEPLITILGSLGVHNPNLMFLARVGCGWLPQVPFLSKETILLSSLWLMTSLLCVGIPKHM